jgi:exodeoxyribonuclease V alpha subunit
MTAVAKNDERLALVERFVERGVLSTLDRHFAAALAGLGRASPEALLGAAFASRAVQRGHVCADLRRLVKAPLLDRDEQPISELELPTLETWRAELSASELTGSGDPPSPLVLDAADRLYLHRYHEYERTLVTRIRERAQKLEPVDEATLRAGLERLFPAALLSQGERRQRTAALLAVLRRFAVISGGPGTGKTHTVAKIIALLFDQARVAGRPPRVLLLAPTGKAAQRLTEALQASLAELGPDKLPLELVPSASTIHRALGFQFRTPTRFRHDAETPLAADVVLVDEASMVDLALMTKLVEAVPSHARLILLGDKDQLASVEAGAILGDICANLELGFSPELGRRLSELSGTPHDENESPLAPPIRDCLVELRQSFRYAPNSGMARLAASIKAGDADGALGLFRNGSLAIPPARGQLSFDFGGAAAPGARATRPDDIALHELSDAKRLLEVLGPAAKSRFGSYLAEPNPELKLEKLAAFRILCAHRYGELGVEALNRLVEGWLADAGLLKLDREWYSGRPLLVTRNDYELELYNGDVGVVAPDADGRSKAWFKSKPGKLRSFLPARLPAHETVFAMTVHKAQGSEFDHIFVILPAEPSPIVTRELVYTGVTRARRRVELVAGEGAFRAALAQRIERASGLRDALWGV